MPGLGGRDLSEEHALESADALNRINPDFIRLRTLAIPEHVELYQEYRKGDFQKLGDVEIARELLIFFQALEGITSIVKSDHILNLFENLEGRYPGDKDQMIDILETFLGLDPTEKMLYQVGRRMGVFRTLDDMHNKTKRSQVERACHRAGIGPDNVEETVDQLMKRFI
jgi:hypothetical protein